ncbi:MAG: hypothetical protein JEZ08_16950 [Clostridiales bacterium]|nr:hypothetical protein [Clostridiales bacterium]
MNQSYNQLFDEKDLLEENKFQTIYKGCYKDQPQHRVVIQKFKMNDQFNTAFKDFLDNTLQNKLHIEILQDEIILVSKYIEGDNISLHLNFASVTEQERIDYLYDYLHQATAYIGFEHYLLNILIASNQIVFKDHQLYLKEQINLDRKLNDNIPFTMVAKNIGQVMQRILITNYNELKTSDTYDNIHAFTESLIRREKDYQCFDDLFSDFKAIYFKKQGSKNQTLVGNAHPNNIFMEFVEVNEYDARTKEINNEVTDEERAFLTGNNTPEPIQDLPDQTPDIPDDVIEEIYEPRPPIDWSDGPIEENIDLSKLVDGVSSLEEVLVRNEPVRKVNKVVPDKHENVTTETTSLKDNENFDEEEPVYGLPNHFKDPAFQTHHEEDDEEVEEEKRAFNFLIPASIFAALIVVILSFLWLPKLFAKDPGEHLPPVADFQVEITGNTLHCTNLSIAYNDEIIAESFWELSKDGKFITSTPGKNNADYEVKGLSPGVYNIKLTVTDSKGLSSDPVVQDKEYQTSESKALENQIQTQNELASDQAFKSNSYTNDSEEILNQYNMSSTVNVVEDTYTLNKGTKSYRIDLNKNDGTASLYFDPIEISQGATVSFMLMSNEAKPIKIQIVGYYKGNNIFNKEVISNKGTVLDWSTLSIQMSTTSPTDKLVIKLEAEDTIVWFDELSIRTFK